LAEGRGLSFASLGSRQGGTPPGGSSGGVLGAAASGSAFTSNASVLVFEAAAGFDTAS
jgi:hypothetical protein